MDHQAPSLNPHIQHHSATVHHSSDYEPKVNNSTNYHHSQAQQGGPAIPPHPQPHTQPHSRHTSSNAFHSSHPNATQPISLQSYPSHQSGPSSRHHLRQPPHARPSGQAQSFDDSQLLYSTSRKEHSSSHPHGHHGQYPHTEPHQLSQLYSASVNQSQSQSQAHSHAQSHPQQPHHHHHHQPHQHSSATLRTTDQRRRRHSSTSRLKSSQLHHQSAQSSSSKNSTFIASITNNFMSFGAPFLFDWRLFCERGQPRYVHKHDGDGLRVDECEARFLKKIAEEEKASLNAISDDEDHSNSLRHQQRKNKSGNAAANVECLGSVRKSGFLSVKKWLIRKKNSLELARKRGWKGYWVCLKGTTLLFYRCDCDDNKSGGHVIEARPRHLIFVDACLVQAIPEHPKRDFVFCLSTAFGDAYLLDAPCLVERDHWIAAIHCACAAQLARSSGRATVSHVLHKEIKRLDESVELDTRARTEAEQIISAALAAGSLTAAEAKAKQQQLLNQIHNLEEKIEKNRTEIFRFRAYLAALINDEDPNPKTLLSQTTKRSKMQLNRLGVFTVSSLHAFNCAKNPTIIGNITRSRSTEDNLCADHLSGVAFDSFAQAASSSGATTGSKAANLPAGTKEAQTSIVVKMLNGEHHMFDFNTPVSVDLVLAKILPAPIARDYYLRRTDDPSIVFKRHETVLDHNNETLEIVPKIMFTCEMTRDSNETLFGFSVESELCQDDLRVYVSRVEPNSLASSQSIRRSDEIVVINGALVQDLDMMYVESVLQEELALCLTIRAGRDEVSSSRPTSRCTTTGSSSNATCNPATSIYCGTDLTDMPTTEDLIESLVCPPPPPIDVSQMILSEKQLSKYIVPKVDSYLLSPTGADSKHDMFSTSKTSSHPTRSFSSKSASKCSTSKCGDQIARPHSAAASYQRGHHHHHHHHHGGSHHARNNSGTIAGPSHHHHHHHHHHHSSTKHIYHITDPMYGLIEQHMLTGYDPQQPAAATTAQMAKDPACANVTTNPVVNATALDEEQVQNEFAQLSTNDPLADQQQQIDQGGGTIAATELTTASEPLYETEHTHPIEISNFAEAQLENDNGFNTSNTNNSNEVGSMKCTFGSEITNEKLRKVIREMLDTEITYCHSLDQLMTLYLDPLLKSSTLTNLDARKLIGSIPAVIVTQNQFREDLFTIINDDEFNLEGIAKCFLNYCNDFKNYSTFCVSHAKAIKLLADEKSILHEWITKQSKSSKHPNMYSLESYLIRPIQRILKYPLLLAQIKTLCQKDSQQYFKIQEALRAVESVAEHINEMQRINEEYGSIFENLIASTKVNAKNKNTYYLFDLTPISLLHYGGVDWINSVEFLGKSFRKSTANSGGIHLHSMCFVFKQCVVFLCKETIRHSKSKKQASTSDMEIIRHQVLIPVSEVQVRACPQTEHELDYKWELIQLKTSAQGKRSEKIFRLSNSTNEYRNAFLRTVRQIIREDVRRMSILSARPASTRSETSPTAKKSSEKRHIVSFASTQNLTRCGYCGEDFTKMVKQANNS